MTTEDRRLTGVVPDVALERPPLEELARRRLAEDCPYAFCFSQITFRYVQGVLILQGRLPYRKLVFKSKPQGGALSAIS